MQSLTIMKPGCFVDMNGTRVCLTPHDLEHVVSSYDPATHQAPLVLGHPAADASSPAHGWIKRLSISPTGALIALVENISEAFKAMVKAGQYRHLSPSFWTPNGQGNPRPGGFSLRHVGALGAATPAVKGLSKLAFSATPCPLPPCACDFSAPVGWIVDPERLATMARINDLAAEEGLTFLEAAVRLG